MSNWIDRMQRLTSGGLKLFFAPQLSVGFRPMRGLMANFVQTIAMFLATARLIPATHRALRPTTPGDARLGEVLALAYVNVRRPDVRVDQVAVFGAVISLMVLLTLVLFGTIMGMLVGSAHAFTFRFTAPDACTFGGPVSFFSVSCTTDMAQQWIDMLLLGQTNWFQSQIASAGMRAGLESMFQTYSYAMLIVAGFLVMYHLLGIVAGTAHSGKVGGGLMHTIWAPLRLIMAVGMLVPVGLNGLNSGQLVVTQVAKWGSALGSNVWMAFATGFASETGAMLIAPPFPQVTPLLHDALKILVCEVGYNTIAANSGDTFHVDPSGWQYITGSTEYMNSFDYTTGSGTNGEGGVCGSVHMPNPDYSPSGDGTAYLGSMLSIASAPAIRKALLSAHADALGEQMEGGTLHQLAQKIYDSADSANTGYDLTLTDLLMFNEAVIEYRVKLGRGITNAINATGMSADDMVADATQRGWVSAAVWFNTIARINGMLVDYAQEVPVATPDFKRMADDGTLDTIETALQSVDESLISMVAWSPSSGVDLKEPDYLQAIGGSSGGDSAFESQLKVMASNFAKVLGKTTDSDDEVDPSTLPAIASSLRLNTANPLAELSAMGNRIIMLAFQTVRTLDDCKKQATANAAAAAGGGGGGGSSSCGGGNMGSMGNTLMAIIGGSIISAGVTLAYVLPMIPFIRFMFGILSWILTLFESVIAIPVVALAHISMDGEGLSGPMARGAYLLLLQLFVRPTLMVFGLIIALLIFALNEFYSMAVRSAEGGGSMSAVAGVVYTVMYGALAYAFANASFKAIDQVPEQVLRWIGGNQVSGVDGTHQVMGAVSQTAAVGSHAVSAINRGSAHAIASRV